MEWSIESQLKIELPKVTQFLVAELYSNIKSQFIAQGKYILQFKVFIFPKPMVLHSSMVEK